MKSIFAVLTLAVFLTSTAPAVWAQGEPNPPRSDVKSGKNPTVPQTKADCEKAGMKWNDSTKKCSK